MLSLNPPFVTKQVILTLRINKRKDNMTSQGSWGMEGDDIKSA